MDYFQYHDNRLFCEDVPVESIVEQVGSPVYIYSAHTFRRHYQNIVDAFAELEPLVCYSVKGCSNINICKLLAGWGSGFDVVSGGELFRVLQAGGDAKKVVYAGVGKTDEEINQALEAGIGYFNIESEAELQNLIRLAAAVGKNATAALRINPDVDPHTHRYTTTGKKETKFGVDLDRAYSVFEKFGHDPHIKLSALHLHIGSPVYSTEPYVQAITKTLGFIDRLRGAGFTVDTLDIGGGFGADYKPGQSPSSADYAAAIIPLLRNKGLRLILEPGRSISGNAGIMVTRVLYTKRGGDKKFIIVDAAMTDLIRPALYDAYHFVWPVQLCTPFDVNPRAETAVSDDGQYHGQQANVVEHIPNGAEKVDIVGPVCESADFLAKDRMLPPLKRNDLLAVFTAGAYGFVMSSQYNSRPRAAEVLVDGDNFSVIRRRESYDDLIALEK